MGYLDHADENRQQIWRVDLLQSPPGVLKLGELPGRGTLGANHLGIGQDEATEEEKQLGPNAAPEERHKDLLGHDTNQRPETNELYK